MQQSGHTEDILKISTLGRFRVERQNRLLSEESKRVSRVWELFKYLLTHRSRDVSNDMLADSLWKDRWPDDPGRALRNLVYRLRRALGVKDHAGLPYIALSGGFYRFNTATTYWLDVEEFEDLQGRAVRLASAEPQTSIRLYQRCLELYKGEFLPCQGGVDWLLPVQNYYRRLFLDAFLSYVGLLWRTDDRLAIGAACEHALQIEPLEEAIHLQFIDYLLRSGKAKAAQSHYDYLSSLLYGGTGARPSAGLTEVHRRISAAI